MDGLPERGELLEVLEDMPAAATLYKGDIVEMTRLASDGRIYVRLESGKGDRDHEWYVRAEHVRRIDDSKPPTEADLFRLGASLVEGTS